MPIVEWITGEEALKHFQQNFGRGALIICHPVRTDSPTAPSEEPKKDDPEDADLEK